MIKQSRSTLNFVCAALVIYSIFVHALPSNAQDLIQTSDITNGTSIFIFRQPSNKQSKISTKNFAQRPPVYRLAARKKMISHRQPTVQNQAKINRAAKINVPTTTKQTANKKLSAAAKIKMSETFAGIGEQFLDEKDAGQAIENFKKALELNPKNQQAKLGLSEADTRRADALDVDGSAAAAIPFYREAMAMNPENSRAFGGLGEVLEETGDQNGALENYLSAVTLDPSADGYLTAIGIIYYQKGNYEQAANLSR